MMIGQSDDSPELTDLERAVLGVAFAANAGDNAQFRAQVDAATALSRTPSGVGFMTKLAVPEALRVADRPGNDGLPTVRGEHPDLPSGAEFVLQVKAGRINTIEAFCFEGMWPGDESIFQVALRP
jgi:hypothetical protein